MIFDLLLQTNKGGGGAGEDAVYKVLKEVVIYARFGSMAIMTVIGVCAIFFAIWVGFNFARANEESKRRNAKNQLIYAIVGMIAIVAFVALMQQVLVKPNLAQPSLGGQTGFNKMRYATLNAAYRNLWMVTECVCLIIYPVATVFSVYCAWTMLAATDEGKLKNARWHLVYVLLAVVVVALLHTFTVTAFSG